MASGIESHFTSVTIDGTTHTNKWMDLDDVFEPKGSATKIANVGIQNTAGTDVSNLYLPLAGGTQIGEATGIQSTSGTDLRSLFAAKGSGLAGSLSIIPSSRNGDVFTQNPGSGGSYHLYITTYALPKDWTAYTFSWTGYAVTGGTGSPSIHEPYGTNNRQFHIYLSSNNGPIMADGVVSLTVTDNATGQSETISGISWSIVIEDGS